MNGNQYNSIELIAKSMINISNNFTKIYQTLDKINTTLENNLSGIKSNTDNINTNLANVISEGNKLDINIETIDNKLVRYYDEATGGEYGYAKLVTTEGVNPIQN